MLKNDAKKLPHQPGVYIYKDASGKPLYVGKARDLYQRVVSYFRVDLVTGEKTVRLIKQARSLSHIVTDTEMEALLLETDLIKRLKPPFNIRMKDDKAFKFIKVTVNEDFPRVITVRKKLNDKAKYFGPFPEGRTVTYLLKDLRRMFPYCNEAKKTGKACFYNHLGLCPGVCAGTVSKTDYRRQINRLVQFLSGKKARVVLELEKEMRRLAGKEKFEEAQAIRDKLQRIEYITQNFHTSQDFIDNPNLREDIRREEIEELLQILSPHFSALRPPIRTEVYDMSNLSGQLAVGSMVVFVGGEPVKGFYRRFRIKNEKGRGDTDFMAEVLKRRFSHYNSKSGTNLKRTYLDEPQGPSLKVNSDSSFTQHPDLILVDGGVPQVQTALHVLKDLDLDIPVIGLAKRWEVIVLPSGQIIRLPRNSKALQLLQRLRDEAHRFAKAYHLKLRKLKKSP